MAKFRFALSLLAALVLASGAQAQSSDWKVVERLNPGTRISVKVKKTYACVVERVTDTELICRSPSRLVRRTRTYPRAEIREVRLATDRKDYAVTGMAVGAAIGTIAGASLPTNVEATRPFTAIATGFVGGFFGHVTGMAIGLFRKGQVIYKR
jgi:uncharacterized protein YcfJ